MGGLVDRNAARRIANGDRELTAHLKREFERAARDVADAAQRRILEAAAPEYPGAGLRAEIAATVQVRGRRTTAGFSAQIRSNGRLMPPGKQNLGAYANAGRARWRRWRHPVYGNREVWVSQEWPSAAGWFDATVRDHAQEFSDAVRKSIAETQAYLEGRL